MSKILMVIILLFSISSLAKSKAVDYKHRVSRKGKVVIAVIDTGFDEMKYGRQVKLCKTGHLDKGVLVVGLNVDYHNHGTHIAGLIAKNANKPYCMMIMNYYSSSLENNLLNTLRALRYAINLDVDIINYSAGGIEPSRTEKRLIQEALDKNIIVVVAAGNEHKNLDHQAFYPAMYDDRIIVVGNLKRNKYNVIVREPVSNYGKQVDLQVIGTKVSSLNGLMTGTSQSTAIITGLIVKYAKSYRKYEKKGIKGYYSPLHIYMESNEKDKVK